MSECDICGDNYTSKLRRQLTCDECHNENCLQCFRNFLVNSEDFSPKCMHCDKVYSYVEIAEITKDKTFCKKVLDNFVKNSLVKEKNKFQIYQEEIKKQRKIEQLLEDIDMAKVEYEIKVQEINRHINILKNNKDISLLNYTFIKKCSVQDCQGMLDKDWTCGVCSQETCSECHQHKTENHVCDEDELKTIQAIKKESKECPNCGVGISKIDGCFDGDVEILTFDNNVKKVKDIILGDKLMGIDGTERVVQNLCQGEDEMYEIIQKTGINYKVNSKHTLLLQPRPHKKIYNLENKFKLVYFDKKYFKFIRKTFQDEESVNKFNSSIKEIKYLEIIVEDYLKIPKETRKMLYGVKSQGFDYSITSIDIKKIGKGKYYGFKVDKDSKVLMKDYTCLRNCDQMWCIQCQTAFSWKTGNILINQNIHNPEYFRYRRDRGLDIPRAPGDNPGIIMDDLFDPFNRINNFQVSGIINLNMNNTIIALINEDPTLVSPNTILNFFSRAFNWSVNNLMTQNNMYDKSKIIGIQLLKKEIGTENWEASMKKNTKKYYYDTKLFEILNDFKEKSKISFREILNIMEHGNNSNNEDIEKVINKLRDFYNDLSNLNRDIEFYSKLFGYKKFSFEITTKTEWGRIEKYIFKQ